MNVQTAHDQREWDDFLAAQPYSPFLQSWTMGEVYADIGQTAVRLVAEDEKGEIEALCFGHVVAAKRGKHISVPYGPVLAESLNQYDAAKITTAFVASLKKEAIEHGCSFLRISPFWLQGRYSDAVNAYGSVSSPLHLLAEHVWVLPLKKNDGATITEDALLSAMRKTTRNLIRRAEKDGVTVNTSKNPVKDLDQFIRLHDETRKRHGFTAYTNAFFRSQVRRFSERKELTLYLASYQGEVIASSIHMHAFGETSYHHGASSAAHKKVPASYLLQWTAIRDALKRGDRMYNFWGIAPTLTPSPSPDGRGETPISSVAKLPFPPRGKGQGDGGHPFAGVTLFKTGFGGHVLNLVHCKDTPVSKKYWLTYGFERLRKWRRGF